jgi:hypothetical protein
MEQFRFHPLMPESSDCFLIEGDEYFAAEHAAFVCNHAIGEVPTRVALVIKFSCLHCAFPSAEPVDLGEEDGGF